MLPSKELKDLSKRVDICLSGRVAPKGCDIRYRQMYWALVFDSKGELVAGRDLSKVLTQARRKGKALPQALVSFVDQALKKESLESLERRYSKQRGSADAFAAITAKVKSMDRIGQMRAASFLEQAAPDTHDPALSRARGIFLAADACRHQVINHGAFLALQTSIESFIDDHRTHPICLELIEPLFEVALRYRFDVPARCEAYAESWRSAPSNSRAERESSVRLARAVLTHCQTEVDSVEPIDETDYDAPRRVARLGQAKKLLQLLDTRKTIGVMKPIHAEWRREAAAKLDRASKTGKRFF